MPVVAVEGRAGSLAPVLGHLVADELEIDYIDRLLLAQIAKRVGSTVQALAESERRPTGVVERLAGSLDRRTPAVVGVTSWSFCSVAPAVRS